LQPGGAYRGIFVRRTKQHLLAAFGECGTRVDDAETDLEHALGVGQHLASGKIERICQEIDAESNAVAQRRRPEEWQHQIRPRLDAIDGQCLAEVVRLLWKFHAGCVIGEPADPEQRVDERPVQRPESAAELSLQHGIGEVQRLAEVAVHVADAAAACGGKHRAIDSDNRFQNRAIHRLVDAVDRAIRGFPWIERCRFQGGGALEPWAIVGASAGGDQQRKGRNGNGLHGRCLSPAPAEHKPHATNRHPHAGFTILT